MKIYYGTKDYQIDITDTCMSKCKNNNRIVIPHNDVERSKIFTDPVYGISKTIYIEFVDTGNICKYDEFSKIELNLDNGEIQITTYNSFIDHIHRTLKLNYGSFKDECPEQIMVSKYLTGNENILEIGANIGRVSLVISFLLKDSKQMVSLESDKDNAKKLLENRDLNNYNFYVEHSALSKRKLIQKDWITLPSDILLDGYKWVDTITFEEIEKKYNITFDTLVIDCEGAFFYIMQDMPYILTNISMIIIENDYSDISHKKYVDNVLKMYGFDNIYTQSGGNWPCLCDFYEVWKKR
jgi:FkbM family methyltransferase